MKSLNDLKKIQEKALKLIKNTNDAKGYRITVGMATCGIAAGARPVMLKFIEETNSKGINADVINVGCVGVCRLEPIVEITDPTGEVTTYVKVDENKVEEIVETHLVNGEVLEEYCVSNYEEN